MTMNEALNAIAKKRKDIKGIAQLLEGSQAYLVIAIKPGKGGTQDIHYRSHRIVKESIADLVAGFNDMEQAGEG